MTEPRDARLEALAAADEAFTAAGERYNEKWAGLVAAKALERKAAQEQQAAYQTAFAAGIIIERVVQFSNIYYPAGERPYSLGNAIDEAVRLPLDEEHAKSLQGVFAHNVRVISASTDRMNRTLDIPPLPQGVQSIQFTVMGLRANSELPERLDPISWIDDENPMITYTGTLDAIEWRLPTDDEVATYSQQAVASNA